ncbi:hypothetical protein ACFFP0_06220 [Rhizobium puerariae]|uniref:Transposase n=1 Tax=Rhizobium puerariae TaxID=1585791 RepID=A0ABV6ACT3_9HYPH
MANDLILDGLIERGLRAVEDEVVRALQQCVGEIELLPLQHGEALWMADFTRNDMGVHLKGCRVSGAAPFRKAERSVAFSARSCAKNCSLCERLLRR